MKLIVEVLFGSHLYGTNTPQSDFDYKGVFLPPGRDILLQRVQQTVSTKREKQPFEKNVAGEIDQELFSLQKYLSLLAEGQTVAMDMFFAPAQNEDGLWRELKANKYKLLSRRPASFIGYCRTQANKYGIKGSRVAAAKSMVEFLTQAISRYGNSAKLSVISDEMEKFIGNQKLEHTRIIMMKQYNKEDLIPHLECCNRKSPYTSSLKTALDIYSKLFEEYGARAIMAEKNEGVDWKALSHAVRVGREAIEFLETGNIEFPLSYADHILEIKLGKLSYAQVAEEIEGLIESVELASKNSHLPDNPDYKFIDDFVEYTYRSRIFS